MKLIFAQGNPGKDYAHTRHNVGFFMLDRFAAAYNAMFSAKPKFHADIAEMTVEGEKILLVKPTTIYNETGQAARSLIDFYKLDPTRDFLVIYDELALPFGTIRTRLEGGDAGNNGIKSLNMHIGARHARIRIGTYSPLRERVHDAEFVLSPFSQKEKTTLPAIYEQVEHFVLAFIRDQFDITKVSLLINK